MEFQARHITHEEVEKVLDRLRPGLIADGGNVELIGVEADGTVRVSLRGACATGPAQTATLRVGLEEPLPLLKAFPGLTAVIPV